MKFTIRAALGRECARTPRRASPLPGGTEDVRRTALCPETALCVRHASQAPRRNSRDEFRAGAPSSPPDFGLVARPPVGRRRGPPWARGRCEPVWSLGHRSTNDGAEARETCWIDVLSEEFGSFTVAGEVRHIAGRRVGLETTRPVPIAGHDRA